MVEPSRHPRTPLVLIINDQEWSTRSLESILSPNGYAVLRAYTASKGFERAQSAHPDIVVVGAVLPDMDGVGACAVLRNEGYVAESTAVVLTSTGRLPRDQRLAAFRAGAWECLGHPMDAEEVLLKFHAFVRAKHDADRAREEGLVDGLTGLYSLSGLARRARELGSQAYRQHAPLACVVLAADPETEVAGLELFDTVRELATVFRASGRISDAIGRVGEAEFAIFAPGTDTAGAARLAERFSEAFRAAEHGRGVKLTTGYHAVADFREAGIEPGALLERASTALHAARRTSEAALH